jgi:hypothetical protein
VPIDPETREVDHTAAERFAVESLVGLWPKLPIPSLKFYAKDPKKWTYPPERFFQDVSLVVA